MLESLKIYLVRIAIFTFSASGFGFSLKHKIFFRLATILQPAKTYTCIGLID